MAKAMLQIFAALLVLSATAKAQTNNAATNFAATYISGDQIQSTTKELQAVTKGLSFHIVDVGDANVGIAIQHRLKLEPGGMAGPIMHTDVTEVYIVQKGSATLATGGTMTDQSPMKAGSEEGTGPGFRGKVAKPNAVQDIKAGDVVLIPKNTPHWFTAIPEDLTYLVVRIDPSKTTGVK
ncbi:MAG: cupin domain-containing protein [Candidatus Acidiferrales bacterium]